VFVLELWVEAIHPRSARAWSAVGLSMDLRGRTMSGYSDSSLGCAPAIKLYRGLFGFGDEDKGDLPGFWRQVHITIGPDLQIPVAALLAYSPAKWGPIMYFYVVGDGAVGFHLYRGGFQIGYNPDPVVTERSFVILLYAWVVVVDGELLCVEEKSFIGILRRK